MRKLSITVPCPTHLKFIIKQSFVDHEGRYNRCKRTSIRCELDIFVF